MKIKWLHLSDIHFNFKNYNSTLLRRDFISRIHSLSENEGFTHLFLSGDVLHRNNSMGTDNSDSVTFIRDLANAMRIELRNVIIVPGNHDHDRAITNSIVQSIYCDVDNCDDQIEALPNDQIESLLKAFSNYETVYRELFLRDYYDSYKEPHTVIDISGLTILRLNTAWLDIDSKNTSALRCGRKQLLDTLEQHERLLKNSMVIAVGHHPMDDFSAEEKKHLLALFHRFNIGIYFCGHRHKASIDYYKEYDVLQLTCPGGYHDGYSLGGYVSGVIDTDKQFYKAEFYKWDNDNWYIESTLEGTDSRGIYYFDTLKYKHNGAFTAADFCVIGPHVPMRELIKSIGSDVIDVLAYPYSCLDMNSIDWDLHQNQVVDFATGIKKVGDSGNIVHLYPLAPIPMLMAIGFELQNNSKIIVHQRDRDSGEWVYSEKDEGIDCVIDEKLIGEHALAIAISCSFEVQEKQIASVLRKKKYDLLDVKASTIAPGFPLYHADVMRIVKKLFRRLNEIITHYEEVHIFAAIPAGMAVEIGRNMLQSVYSNIATYQLQQNRYVPAIVIQPIERQNTDLETHKKNVFYIEEYNQNIVFVPLLGEIACGSISEAIVEADEYLPMAASVLGSGEHFIIKAVGDSMIGAGIDEGDYVLIRSQNSADDGQIVVARDGDSTTLKRLYHDNKRKKVILRAENPRYRDQEFDAIEVQGVAIKVIKNLE